MALYDTIRTYVADIFGGAEDKGLERRIQAGIAGKNADITSKEAHEAAKAFNSEMNLRDGFSREIAGYLKWASLALLGGVIGAGATGNITNFFQLFSYLNTWLMLGAALAVGGTAIAINQFAIKRQSDKNLDLVEFRDLRQAKQIAKELATELRKDEVPSPSVDAITETTALRTDGKSWAETVSVAEVSPSQSRVH